MIGRVLSADVLGQDLDHLPLAEGTVLEGRPRAGVAELGAVGGAEVGVWELTEGTVTDVEADEVFVVLAGSGRVGFEDGSVVELAPGVAVRLHEGERTTWVVTAPLRKIYVTA